MAAAAHLTLEPICLAQAFQILSELCFQYLKITQNLFTSKTENLTLLDSGICHFCFMDLESSGQTKMA